ncbi:hypothetical protein LP420_36570 [Massilia sp. B-10]|nr:hypothetical protein LP420_36570 [Massilia sp. B-10]
MNDAIVEDGDDDVLLHASSGSTSWARAWKEWKGGCSSASCRRGRGGRLARAL